MPGRVIAQSRFSLATVMQRAAAEGWTELLQENSSLILLFPEKTSMCVICITMQRRKPKAQSKHHVSVTVWCAGATRCTDVCLQTPQLKCSCV